MARSYNSKHLDVTSEESVRESDDDLNGRAIDLLVNNAAIYPREGTHVGELDYDSWGDTLDANLFGACASPKRCWRTWRKAAKTDRGHKQRHGLAQVADGRSVEQSGTSYQYRTSKAGAEYGDVVLSKELAPRGISVVMISRAG